jgi:hypothetical protein
MRMIAVTEIYQNYQAGSLSNQLTVIGRGAKVYRVESESVSVTLVPLLGLGTK